MRTIKVRVDENDNAYLLLEELIPGYQYEADSYTIEVIDDDGVEALLLKFYDKDGNLINVNEEDE